MKVLAVDPGYERLGIAIIERHNNKEILLYSDCFHTSKDIPFEIRLKSIGKEIARLIEEYSPDIFASESLFFTKNQKTALRVASVRGVILFIATMHNLPVFEYTPLQIKIAITGYGKSDKKSVTHMVNRLLLIKKEILLDDEYDAIAIGLTCFASEKNMKTKATK